MKKQLESLLPVAAPRLVRPSSSLARIVVNDWNGKLQSADALLTCGQLGIQGAGNHGDNTTLSAARYFRVSRRGHGHIKLYNVDRRRPRSLEASLILWHTTDVIRCDSRARCSGALNRPCNLN